MLILQIATYGLITPVSAHGGDTGHTHFRFGHISWKANPANLNEVVFTVQNAWRLDAYTTSNGRCIDTSTLASVVCTGPNGRAGVGDVIVEFQGETQLDFGDGTILNSDIFRGVLLYRVVAIAPNENWLAGIAIDPKPPDQKIRHIYSGTGPFIAKFDTCCRTSIEQNNPDTEYRVSTLVMPDVASLGVGGVDNDSPVSSIKPIVNCPIGTCEFVIPALDPDGDILEFRKSTTAESGIVTQPPGLSVSLTGKVTWNTVGIAEGLYSTSITIKEKRGDQFIGYVMVDFLINAGGVVGHPPTFIPPTPADGKIFSTVTNGQTVNFDVQCSDIDAGDVVTITHQGLPEGATLTEKSTGNPATSTFNLQPLVEESVVVILFCTDSQNNIVFTSVNIRVSFTGLTADDKSALQDTANTIEQVGIVAEASIGHIPTTLIVNSLLTATGQCAGILECRVGSLIGTAIDGLLCLGAFTVPGLQFTIGSCVSFIFSSASLIVSSVLELLADDPPDPNFTEIVPLEPIQKIEPVGNSAFEVAFTELTNLMSEAGAISRALLTSIERFQGAVEAGDLESMELQAKAIQYYSDLLASNQVEVKAKLAILVSEIIPHSDQVLANIQELQSRLAASGFTSEELQSLKNNGLSDQDIETLRSIILQTSIDINEWIIALNDYSNSIDEDLIPVLEDTSHQMTAVIGSRTITVTTATDTGALNFSAKPGELSNVISLDLSEFPLSPVNLPHGLFEFTISGIDSGSTVIVTIIFPSNVPVGAQYWKFQNGNWFQLPDSMVGDNDSDNVLTLTLTDGGIGDADGLANGVIVDPGGPSFSTDTQGTSGSGGSDGGLFRGRVFAFGDINSPNYDSQPPNIEEVLIQEGSLKIVAKISDSVGVKDANVIIGKKVFPMEPHQGSQSWWKRTLTSADLSGFTSSFQFKIVARDYNLNKGEYLDSAEIPHGALSSNSIDGASFSVTPLTLGHQPDASYSIVATGLESSEQNANPNPQITLKNTGSEPLENIRLMLSPDLKGKFLLSDYAIKSIAPQSEYTVTLKLNGKPNVDEMGLPLPYNGQIIISVDNRTPHVLELSGEVPNESASLQSLFMKTIASKGEQRYKSFEKPDVRISQDANYIVALGSGGDTIKAPSDELIISAGDKPLKNVRIMTSTLSNHFIPDMNNIALLPAGGFVKVKLTSMMNNDFESPRDMKGELLVVPENGTPLTIPIHIGKKLPQDRNSLYEVSTISGNSAISHTTDGIVIRNNSPESIDNVRVILPQELTRVFSLSEDSFRSIEPDQERKIYLQQRGNSDSNVKQILDNYTGEIVVVSSDGMKKIIPINIVWKGISSEHFVINARDNAEELTKAAQVINFLERSYAKTAKIVGESNTKTVIYMTSSLDEVQMLSEALAPSTYVYNEDIAFVWSNSKDVNLLALREFAYRTIMNNYPSYWMAQKLSMDRGNWLVDGVSDYVGARIVGERGIIKDQLDAFIEEPSSFEWYGTSTQSQHGASYTFFKFLAEKYGDAIIDKTLSYLGSTMMSNHKCDTTEQCALLGAVYDANGFNINDKRHDMTFDTIVQEWKEYLGKNYALIEENGLRVN